MTDSVLTYLDSYCERAGDAALLAEPLNLVTNGFFILAAVAVGKALVQQQRNRHSNESWNPSVIHKVDSNFRWNDGSKAMAATPSLDLWLLVASLFAIGIGSGAWHAQPSGTTVLMDVIPITLFMNIYLISALRRLFGFAWMKVMGWWLAYCLLTVAGQTYLPPDTLHGTVMYLPTYAAMVALMLGLLRREPAIGRVFMQVTGVWTLSLIFRTTDLETCGIPPIGTHFLWHTLNAWVLWRLLMMLIKRGA